jgi:hypothetical protein
MPNPMGDPAVVYTSTLNERDIGDYLSLAGSRAVRGYMLAISSVVIIAVALPLAAIALIGRYTTLLPDFKEAALGWSITVAWMLSTFILLNNLIYARIRRRQRRGAHILRRAHTFSVDETALTVTTPFGAECVPWVNLSEIGRKRNVVVFWTDSLMTYCARSDATSEPPDAGDIFDVCSQHLQAARRTNTLGG